MRYFFQAPCYHAMTKTRKEWLGIDVTGLPPKLTISLVIAPISAGKKKAAGFSSKGQADFSSVKESDPESLKK